MRHLERSNPMSNVVWISSGRDFRRTAMAASGGRSVAETSFEFRLERMFAETPAAPDTELFTLKVLERLDRGWSARRFLIGSMGVLGGLVGGYEILGSGVAGQLTTYAG